MRILKIERTEGKKYAWKYLISVNDFRHDNIEFAFINFGEDKGICASAQIGCFIGCTHCATTYADRPFSRNLSLRELVDIVNLIVEDANYGRPVDILDFSGVGDCSANWDTVRAACVKLYREGLIKRYTFTSIAPRKWCEIVNKEMQEKRVLPEKILISMHGSDKYTRRLLIPEAEDPQEAARWWKLLKTDGCRVVLNYILHEDNATFHHLMALAKYVNTNKSWIDAIRISPLNPVPDIPVNGATDLEGFQKKLQELVPREVKVALFIPVGSEKQIACGQMRAALKL